MPNPIYIPVLPVNISVAGPDSVMLESHTFKTLTSTNPQLAADLINENGFNIDTSKISWAPDGKVTIKDIVVKNKLEKALNNGTMAALNICGLCKVD